MKWYKLIFEQIQPIHIGRLNWGVVSETEIFIPGWTMWGALVNAYIIKNKINGKGKINEIQKAFETITNFFPSFDCENILEPKYKNGKFIYKYKDNNNEIKEITEEEFKYKFIRADFKTSVEPISRKSKDEHLYEFEYIVPRFNWIGLIKFKKEDEESFLMNKDTEIYVGGDIKIGYGLLKLKDSYVIKDEELKKWNLDNNGKLNLENKTLKNFLECDKNIEFEGELKLIPEFDFSRYTSIITDAKYYLNVGSKISNSNLDYFLYKGKFLKNSLN